MTGTPAAEAARKRLLALIATASRHVDIMSPSLEPQLLDDPAIVQALIALARRGRQSRIRVLVQDLSGILDAGHSLVALGRRLTTAMEIRVLSEHPEWNRETAVIVDACAGALTRLDDHRIHPFPRRAEARRQAEVFERLWRVAVLSPELRTL